MKPPRKAIKSDIVSYMSEDVDFAIVKQVTNSVSRGKTTTLVSTLLSEGVDCPVSLIDMNNVQDMPTFGFPSRG